MSNPHLKYKWLTAHLSVWEFKNVGILRFIESFDECPVSSAEDIVKFNKDNSEKAMPPRKFS